MLKPCVSFCSRILLPLVLLMAIAALEPVQALAQEPALVLPVGHTGTVNSVIPSPDKKHVLTYGAGSSVFLWELTTGKLVRVYKHELVSNVISAEFSPDGQYFYANTSKPIRNLFVWHVSSGRLLFSSDGDEGSRFSDDSRYLVCSTYSKVESAVEVLGGKPVFMAANLSFTTTLAYGNTVYRISDDRLFKWDYIHNKPLQEIPIRFHRSLKEQAGNTQEYEIRDGFLYQHLTDSTFIFSLSGGKVLASFRKEDKNRIYSSLSGKQFYTTTFNAHRKRFVVNLKNSATSKDNSIELDSSYIASFESDYYGIKYIDEVRHRTRVFLDDSVYYSISYRQAQKTDKIISTITAKTIVGARQLWRVQCNDYLTNAFISDGKLFCLISETTNPTGVAEARWRTEILHAGSGIKLSSIPGLTRPLGTMLATVDNNIIHILDSSYQTISTIGRNESRAEAVRFTGKDRLFTGSSIIDLYTGLAGTSIPGRFTAMDDSSRYAIMTEKTLPTVYRLADGQKIGAVRGTIEQLDAGRLLITSIGDSSQVWDYTTAHLLKTIDGKYENNVADSRGNYQYILFSDPDILYVYSSQTNQLDIFKGNLELIAKNKKYVLTSDHEGYYIYNLENGGMVKQDTKSLHEDALLKIKENLPAFPKQFKVTQTLSSDDGNYRIGLIDSGYVVLQSNYDAGFTPLVLDLDIPVEDDFRYFLPAVDYFTVSDDQKFLFAAYASVSYLVDLKTKQKIQLDQDIPEKVRAVRFSNDNHFLFIESYLGSMGYGNSLVTSVWDAATGKRLIQFTNAQYKEFSSMSPDGKLIAGLDNGKIDVYDIYKAKLLYSYVPVGGTADYLVTDAYGRYDGSETARNLLYFVCGTEIIELDQVKDQLWVPGLAGRIMTADSIHAPKLAELDICGLSPQVEPLDDPDGYRFRILPRKGGLGETVLYINNIEFKRYRPQDLRKTAEGYELQVTYVQLQGNLVSGQQNQVRVKAFTAANTISSRGTVVQIRSSTPSKTPPNLYAVIIGVSDYKGTDLDLAYAAKDAGDLADALGLSAKKLFNTDGVNRVFVYKMTTDSGRYLLPEKRAIQQVFAEIGKKAQPNDILLVFFAGHGVTRGEKKQFYFLTADASRSSMTDAVADVGISTAELTAWINPLNIKAQKRVLIFDACNSGQAINDLVTIGNNGQGYVAARNDERAEYIKAIDKLNEQSGLFVLAASASNQPAYEMSRYNQGVLTYALLTAIKNQPEVLDNNSYLNIDKWFLSAQKTVEEEAQQNGNRQQPQKFGVGNFFIGRVDAEVLASIKLAGQKALFTASNFQNSDEAIADDDLEFSKAVNFALNRISTRTTENSISYVMGSNSPAAYSLSGRYTVSKGLITIRVNIRQQQQVKARFEITGPAADLNALAEKLAREAIERVGS